MPAPLGRQARQPAKLGVLFGLIDAAEANLRAGMQGRPYTWTLRERELASTQLQASLAQARLQALRAQLNPHFLFNTLNATSVLALQGQGEAAAHTLTLLSEMLRLSLDSTLPQEIPVARELEIVDRYLEIQRVRFPDRLSVAHRSDPEALDALIPSLLLQPIVENAFMHGVAGQPGGGEISIRVAKEGKRLTVRVHDSGPGFGADDPVEGIGLRNTRARLEQLYASAQNFAYGTDDRGVWVALDVPYRRHVSSPIPEEQQWTGVSAH